MPDESRQGLDSTRRRMLAVLGGSATVGLAGCSAIFDDGDDGDDGSGDDGDDSDDGDDGSGDDGDDGSGDDGDDGSGDDGDGPEATNADKAQQAWERILENPTPDDVDIQNEAHLEIEEAVRDDMILLPLFHNLGERFWYDWVDVPLLGALGSHHQQHNRTEIEGETELNLVNSTFTHLDPIMSDDTASGTVINNIYETLTHYQDGIPEVQNKLLDEVEASEDGLTWTFHIKEGVQWHDGGELTADDVKYSWRRLIESPNSVRANFMMDTPLGLGIEYEESDGEDNRIEPDSAAIEVVDDYTIEITLRTANPSVLDIVTYDGFAIVSEGIVGDIEGYDGEIDHEEFITEGANGTGPFQLDEFNVDEDVRLVRFDDYHGEVASIESLHWEIIEDSEAAWTYAMEQNADIFGVPTQYYDRELIDAEQDEMGRDVGTYGPVENDEVVNYMAIAELSIYYFAFNAGHVPRPVRQAVAYATNQEELVDEIFQGRGVPAYSFSPPPIWPTGEEGYQEWLDEYPYGLNETDLDSAREVLEDAGYTEDDPFEFELTTYVSPVFEEAAELTRDKLAGTGVEIDLQQSEFAVLQERGEDGDLEMYSLGWIWSWPALTYGHFGFEPKNTNTSEMPGGTNGYYLDWQEELEQEA